MNIYWFQNKYWNCKHLNKLTDKHIAIKTNTFSKSQIYKLQYGIFKFKTNLEILIYYTCKKIYGTPQFINNYFTGPSE